jgi:hypothetical protein
MPVDIRRTPDRNTVNRTCGGHVTRSDPQEAPPWCRTAVLSYKTKELTRALEEDSTNTMATHTKHRTCTTGYIHLSTSQSVIQLMTEQGTSYSATGMPDGLRIETKRKFSNTFRVFSILDASATLTHPLLKPRVWGMGVWG